MAELQRSVTSFRRQGSSGLVWGEGDKFVSGVRDLKQAKANQEDNDDRVAARELRQSQSVGTIGMMERTQSAGPTPYTKDPPSPKLPTCGLFCGLFGKPVVATHQSYSKSKKPRRS